MTDINFLQSDAEVPNYASEVLKPRISLTSDVLDFRKCERKYGLYKIRNFQPSAPTAEFVRYVFSSIIGDAHGDLQSKAMS